MRSAAALELDYAGVLNVVAMLTAKDFYKSMTTHNDHRCWQDVYRPHTSAGQVYLKFTLVDELIIISFKELHS